MALPPERAFYRAPAPGEAPCAEVENTVGAGRGLSVAETTRPERESVSRVPAGGMEAGQALLYLRSIER